MCCSDFLPRPRMREGVKQLVLSVSLSVCQSGEKLLNLKIDRVKQFPKQTVALTLGSKVVLCPLLFQQFSI